MRVAFVTKHYKPVVGGVETHVAEIATRLASGEHEVFVLTHAESDLQLSAEDRIDGVAVKRFPVPVPSRDYAISPALWLYLMRTHQRFDLIHAHGYHAAASLAAARASVSTPLVFTPHYHGTGHTAISRALHRPYKLFGRRIFERAEAVIAVSHAERALIASHFPEATAKLVVVPNGIDAKGLLNARPFDLDDRVVLSAGRLEAYKNVDVTVRAMAALDQAHVLYVLGDGPERAPIKKLTVDLGLQERVRLLGRVDDLEKNRWFRSAGVYVSMSRHEAMGITPLEALVSGAAVVATDIPAHREMARDWPRRMKLVPVGAPAHRVADEIRAGFDESAGSREPVDVLDWADVAARTVEIYESVLARRATPRVARPISR